MSSERIDAALERADDADFSSYVFQYPPLAAWPRAEEAEVSRDWTLHPLPARLHLYVHVPFCATRCTFCRFHVVESTARSAHEEYVESLEAEASRWRGLLGGARAETLYFGGGTPSDLPAPLLRRALAAAGLFRRVPRAQFTFEANPDSLDRRKLALLREAGVDRLTLGVQSLDDAVVARVERTQRNRRVPHVFRWAREAGIPTINVDLMLGLPGQTAASLARDLDEVLSWGPDQVHANPFYPTALTRFSQRGGSLGEADRGRIREMTELCGRRLEEAGLSPLPHDAAARSPEAGNVQLERTVIGGAPLLGLGPGAVSHLPGRRRHVNHPQPAAYARAARAGRLPVFRSVAMGPRRERIEFLLNSLWYGPLDAREYRRRFRASLDAEFPGARALVPGPAGRAAARRALYEAEVVAALLREDAT